MGPIKTISEVREADDAYVRMAAQRGARGVVLSVNQAVDELSLPERPLSAAAKDINVSLQLDLTKENTDRWWSRPQGKRFS